MVRLSETDYAVDWLRQFHTRNQSIAVDLLNSMKLVSHDEFIDGLSNLVADRANAIDGPIGLYAEREIRRYRGVPNRLFREPYRQRRRRAFGSGPKPIAPTRRVNPEVGSEGLITRIITDLIRQDRGKYFSHPGPDMIRQKRIHSFFLLTDFIGSGKRSSEYLTSAWRVASVKSWHSFGLFKFEVFTYSATDKGADKVRSHICNPIVTQVEPCPTIQTVFSEEIASAVEELCIRYDPKDHDPLDSLGFNGTGALIAFGHGCPNNAPRILHKGSRNWTPLFPARVTASSRGIFQLSNQISLTDRLMQIREKRLATGSWSLHTSADGRKIILLLASLRIGPRFNEVLARKTGLAIPEVLMLLNKFVEWGWTDRNHHLTGTGVGVLRHARSWENPINNIDPDPDEMYYPSSLRIPRGDSS